MTSYQDLPPQEPLDETPPAAAPPATPAPPVVPKAAEPQPIIEESGGRDDDGPISARDAQDEIIIASLAQGMSYPAAGAAAGCTGRTVSRRMEAPDFAARVSKRRGERVAQVTGSLTAMSDDALGVLRSVMVEGTTPERLRAAQVTLTLMVRLRHDTEIEERLAAVERRLDDEGGAR